MYKKIAFPIQLICILVFTSCTDNREPTGPIKELASPVKEYFTFFDSGSYWVYEIENGQSKSFDTVKAIYSKYGTNTTNSSRFFIASLVGESFPVAGIEVYQDRILVLGNHVHFPREFELFHDNGSITIPGQPNQSIDSITTIDSTAIEDSLYRNVLKVNCKKCGIQEILFAPRVGIINLKTGNEVYSLKRYNIIYK